MKRRRAVEPRVLLVDDEPNVTEALRRSLRNEPYSVVSAASAREGLAILRAESIDVVVSDEQMPGMLGSELLAIVCREHPETIRIMLTGNATLQTAVAAINEGQIFRFLMKPCNGAELAVTIRQALQHKALLQQSCRLLNTVRRQSALLNRLEDEHPGISKVTRDEDGIVVMEDLPGNVEEFLRQIGCEIEHAEHQFSGSLE